jgi:hypothetical protein
MRSSLSPKAPGTTAKGWYVTFRHTGLDRNLLELAKVLAE